MTTAIRTTRVCATCPTILSRYNHDAWCQPCIAAGRAPKSPDPMPYGVRRPRGANAADVLEALTFGPATGAEIMERTGLRHSGVFSTLTRLLRAGRVERYREGGGFWTYRLVKDEGL